MFVLILQKERNAFVFSLQIGCAKDVAAPRLLVVPSVRTL